MIRNHSKNSTVDCIYQWCCFRDMPMQKYPKVIFLISTTKVQSASAQVNRQHTKWCIRQSTIIWTLDNDCDQWQSYSIIYYSIRCTGGDDDNNSIHRKYPPLHWKFHQWFGNGDDIDNKYHDDETLTTNNLLCYYNLMSSSEVVASSHSLVIVAVHNIRVLD